MRVFVKYNSTGDVLSVSRVEKMPPGMQLYAERGPDEFVMELPPDAPQAKLELIELHEGHKVDVKKKKLIKKP